MMIYAIRNPEYLHVTDEDGTQFLGCEQEWFGTLWQRRSGCGPTVASNLMLYLHRRGAIALPFDVAEGKAGCLSLMNRMWNHVTPSPRGINTIQRFSDGLFAFSGMYGLRLACTCLPFDIQADERTAFREVVRFVAEGLAMDCPVAFLHLSNGDVADLDAWHWVTLVRMAVPEDGERAQVTYYDGNPSAVIDLRTWCDTTRENGGFVHFRQIAENVSMASEKSGGVGI
jgi:hypothetical protein